MSYSLADHWYFSCGFRWRIALCGIIFNENLC